MEFNVCRQKHPGGLHIEHQATEASTQQSEQTNKSIVGSAAAASQTCGHIRSFYEDDCVFF